MRCWKCRRQRTTDIQVSGILHWKTGPAPNMDCPTCGKTLSTERGMRQHYTKIHGESLPNRTCSGCGTDFYDPKARREYCDDCDPNAGEHNGNWKGAKAETECKRCGTTFEYYPSNKEGVYCSDCVAEADEFLGEHYAEVHDIDRIERECDFCGSKITVLVSERKYGHGRFCSRSCQSEWMSENRRGEDHHQWLEGERKYTGKWWSVRREVLERDGFQCQSCGKTADQMGRNPDVHHIVPIREFEDPQEAHQLDNLIALCRPCHRNEEAGIIDVTGPDSDRQ